jgi:hypothetical protein
VWPAVAAVLVGRAPFIPLFVEFGAPTRGAGVHKSYDMHKSCALHVII